MLGDKIHHMKYFALIFSIIALLLTINARIKRDRILDHLNMMVDHASKFSHYRLEMIDKFGDPSFNIMKDSAIYHSVRVDFHSACIDSIRNKRWHIFF